MKVTQSQFRQSLLDPTSRAPEGLVTPDGGHAVKRFDVYRNNVAVGLSDALVAAFPVVHKLVGEAFFRAMAGVYLRQYPPSSPLMMYYGERMPHFLSHFAPAKSLAYLPDVAGLELAMRHAYHAADATPIDAAALGALAPDQLMGAHVTLAPAAQIIVSDHPVHGIYRANTVAGAPPAVNQAETVLITRAGFDPMQHLISPASAACISSLMAGDTLGVAMGKAEADLDLGATLGLLLANGVITSIYEKDKK